tara:strand:+ start:204 stop:1310 length:1107 start_codon:yes stop_codon:yes gene_type:complete
MNSFLSITLDDLETITVGVPVSQNNQDVGTTRYTVIGFNELTEYNFQKKYNLICRTTGVNIDCDPVYSSQDRPNFNNVIHLIADKHPDKKFFIIDDTDMFKIDYKNIKNVKVWPRQYQFTQQHLLQGLSPIQEKKTHWMSCLLGRSDYFRTGLFNTIIDENWHKDNLVSYGCYGIHDRDHDDRRCQDNYMDTGGKEEYREIIPFNNFEKKQIRLEDRAFLSQSVYGCFANVVQESFLVHPFTFLSEKSFKPLLQGLYPIIIGTPGTMTKLSTMGFQIPNYINWQLWDHLPRDEEADFYFWNIVRAQLKELFEKHSLNDISKDWYPYALKNRERMFQLDKLMKEEEKLICRWLLNGCDALHYRRYQEFY